MRVPSNDLKTCSSDGVVGWRASAAPEMKTIRTAVLSARVKAREALAIEQDIVRLGLHAPLLVDTAQYERHLDGPELADNDFPV